MKRKYLINLGNNFKTRKQNMVGRLEIIAKIIYTRKKW